MHGGAIAVLFDSVLSCAVRSHEPDGFGVVTIDLSAHFLVPCAGDIVATARCERRGRSLCFARGEARDLQDRIVAIATGTFKLVPRQGGADGPLGGLAGYDATSEGEASQR